MFLRTEKMKNGSGFSNIKIYGCNICNKEIIESDNHYLEGVNYHLCTECAFIEGKVNETKFLESCGICDGLHHAAVKNNEIIIWTGKKAPWEKNDKDYRNSADYREWRQKVFERDEYICQCCGQVGGELNAHHKKSFKTHKNLRFEVDNGVTLCLKCHRRVHRKGD